MIVSGPIRASYWVVPGALAGGEYPGSAVLEEMRKKLGCLLDAGLCLFIDLTEEQELRPYVTELQELAAARGITVQHVRIGVRDRGVPSEPQLRDILSLIDRALAEGTPAYVHCWGGIGRTGSVIGCWLSQNGFPGQAALDHIATLREGTPDRDRRSPETPEQRAMVLGFGASEPAQT